MAAVAESQMSGCANAVIALEQAASDKAGQLGS